MAGAALDHCHVGTGELQRVARLVADILHPLVAGHMIGHLAERRLEVALQQAVGIARHQVFERVPHRLLHRLHFGVVGEHQRQLLLVHQRARGNRGKDGEAFARQLRQMRNVGFLEPDHGIEIAQFEFRHSAAGFLFHQYGGDLVVRQQLQQVVADARLVVVDVAGGVDRHLAGRLRAGLHRKVAARLGAGTEFRAVVLGQLAVGMDAQHAVDQLADRLVLQAGVDHLHHHWNRGELAHCVGAGQELVAKAGAALLELDRLGTQHGVGEIEIPRMRRHVRAFGHVAEIAQIALVDHLHVVGLGNAVDLHRRRFVHKVEQRGKRGAQRQAAAAAVADIENALKLVVELVLVVEIRVFPVERVAGGGFEAAFAGAHGDPCCMKTEKIHPRRTRRDAK